MTENNHAESVPTESQEQEKPTSVIFDHCVAVYTEMLSQAREEVDGMIYEGHLTKLITGHLGLATPRYTLILNHLKIMGCVEQLRRGGGNSPSRWLLRDPPDEDTFRSIENMNRAKSGKIAGLEQQIRSLTSTMHSQAGLIAALQGAVARQQDQLNRLDSQINDGLYMKVKS